MHSHLSRWLIHRRFRPLKHIFIPSFEHNCILQAIVWGHFWLKKDDHKPWTVKLQSSAPPTNTEQDGGIQTAAVAVSLPNYAGVTQSGRNETWQHCMMKQTLLGPQEMQMFHREGLKRTLKLVHMAPCQLTTSLRERWYHSHRETWNDFTSRPQLVRKPPWHYRCHISFCWLKNNYLKYDGKPEQEKTFACFKQVLLSPTHPV